MDVQLRNKITRIQIRFLGAIRSHKACYEKIQNGDQTKELEEELLNLKKQMVECHEEQKILLKQMTTADGWPMYKFNLYKIPSGALPKKINRRKDLIQPVKIEKKNEVQLPRVRSPSPATPSPSEQSSSSSEDSEEDEVLLQASLPVPLPRPSLLRKNTSLSRHDVHYPKMGRRTRASTKLEDENNMVKELPVYYDPPPSPEPIDEHQAKIKFMAAIQLIPKEALAELLTRKTERKRRSTANNQFLYNNDWEIPAVKRKQYLSPIKSKPSLSPHKSEKKKLIEDQVPAKSPQPDCGTTKCKVCATYDTLVTCAECDETFHPKCSAVPELEQSFLLCRRCSRAKNYTKPEETLEDRDTAEVVKEGTAEEDKAKLVMFQEKLRLRNHLVKVLRCRMIEKAQMERNVLKLSESLALQDRVKMDLVQEATELGAKVDNIRSLVTLYQMEDGKPRVAAALTSPKMRASSLPLTPEDVATPPLTPQVMAASPLIPEEPASLPPSPTPPLTPKSSDDGSAIEFSMNSASEDLLLGD